MDNARRGLFKRKFKAEVYAREAKKIDSLGTLQKFGFYWSIGPSNPFHNERLRYTFNSLVSRQHGD